MNKRAAAPGCSLENAIRVGPVNVSAKHSNSVPSTARRNKVLRTTRIVTPASRADLRNSVIFSTVTPRESATTAERAPLAASFTSATIACLS